MEKTVIYCTLSTYRICTKNGNFEKLQPSHKKKVKVIGGCVTVKIKHCASKEEVEMLSKL